MTGYQHSQMASFVCVCIRAYAPWADRSHSASRNATSHQSALRCRHGYASAHMHSYLQGVFPSCDVARMVELLPQGFLLHSQQSMLKRVAAINIALRDSLPGANIDMMVQEDPTILFEDRQTLSSGLRELHDLWDVDETALGNSNPWELALAIRTMSDQEPPETI